MLNKILLSALALIPLSSFAAMSDSSEWENGQFEVNALFGRADKHLDNLNFYGGSVAAGYYFGDHLLQLEFGALLSNSRELGDIEFGAHPADPNRFAIFNLKRAEIQDIPVSLNYRYGFEFGADDCIRLEVGPTLGVRARTFRSKYDLIDIQTDPMTMEVTTKSYSNIEEQSGYLAFDYGVGVTLRARVDKNISVHAGYRYIRTTGDSFKTEIKELNVAGGYAYRRVKLADAGAQYFSLGIEYRF